MGLVIFFQVLYLSFVTAQTGVIKPLVSDCVPNIPRVLCINQYASVMPYPFFRNISNGTSNPPFPSTFVPNDPSFAKVEDAEFLIFDFHRGLEILGSEPSYEFVFEVSEAVHEAPVYVASENKLFLSQVVHI